MKERRIVYRVEDGMDRDSLLCTTYQMRNFYAQFRDGYFSNLDVMNLMQHLKAAKMCGKGQHVLDVCCGRSLMLPLLRYHAKDIASYTGVDIDERNIREAIRGASRSCSIKGGLTPDELANYYPFDVGWKKCDAAEMGEVIQPESIDFVIYTSALEHMHPEHGRKSLVECHKVMKRGSKMFLSCPNTPGNGYETQYRAHIYEWGYEELKSTLDDIGFDIAQEVGLVMKGRQMDEFFDSLPDDVRELYRRLREYVPREFLSTVMAAPFPQASDEILFTVTKR